MKRLVLILAAVAALIVTPGRAGAHAELVGSSPPNGAVLREPPTAVEVRFSEPVTAAFTAIQVRDSAGVRVDAGDGRVDPQDPTRLVAGLRPLGEGLYTISYRVTSLDGHVVQGTLAFSVGTAPPPAEAAGGAGAPGVSLPAGLLHGLTQWLSLLLAGLPAFLLLVWTPVAGVRRLPGSLRLVGDGLSSLLILSGLGELGLYAVQASGEPLSAGLLLNAATGTRTGQLWLVRSALGLLAGSVLTYAGRLGGPLTRALALLPGAGLLLTLSLQSHAMATRQWLPVAADFVHLLAAAAWAGGLAGFALTLPSLGPAERRALLDPVIRRFTPVAAAAVLLLAGTGAYGALLHVPGPDAVTTTTYGRTLATKLALLVPVLALGALNMVRRGHGRFDRAVWAELALMVAIVAATGFLTSMPPARAEIRARSGPFSSLVHLQPLALRLKITPARIGMNTPTVEVAEHDGTPISGASVGLRVRERDHDIGLHSVEARETEPGVYVADPIIFGMPGDWEVEVVVLTRAGQEVRYPFVVSVP